MTYDDAFDKFKLIHEHNNLKKDIEVMGMVFEITPESDDNFQNNSIVVSNKKSQEQLKEERRIRKQKQREKLRAKYGDEEYRRIRAQEISTNRAKKNQNK